MSFHTWLASTPKYHLMSSVMDDTAGQRSREPCSLPKDAGSRHEAAVKQTTPILLTPLTDDQAATPRAAAYSSTPLLCNSRHGFPSSGRQYQPITPPADSLDAPSAQSIELTSQIHWNQSPSSSSLKAVASQQNLLTPPTEPPNQLHLQSRDREHTRLEWSYADQTVLHSTEWLLPSPPTSPKTAIVQRRLDTTSTIKSRTPTLSEPNGHRSPPTQGSRRKQSHDIGPQHSPDPMFQTSTDPHYWSTNCTVLKADTSIGVGNVISPTCMVGLPFGGMTEMALPLPSTGLSGVSDDE